jgi:hypothetical protein
MRFRLVSWPLCVGRASALTSPLLRTISTTPGTTQFVVELEKQLGTTDPEATGHKLEALYPAMDDLKTWKPGESEQIAWESHQLAEADVYGALGIPERSCSMHSCDPATSKPVTSDQRTWTARGMSPAANSRKPAIGWRHCSLGFGHRPQTESQGGA